MQKYNFDLPDQKLMVACVIKNQTEKEFHSTFQ